jgi:glycosyltransferase involved in cell wall biosynthesis
VAALDSGIAFCFACRGNRAGELKAALRPDDRNVRLAGFADESELEARLAAADIHLLSLKPEWSGVVVPSKFFGSLAAGRPVLYLGPPDSAVAEWIDRFDLGLVLGDGNVEDVARRLVELAAEPGRIATWQRNAFDAYHTHFSKKIVMDGWDRLLRAEYRALERD